ncbi:MAG: aspartate-semialdehyde dehydrogenase [Elusimicrobiota bacterium]|nr:aspartate-semialdehyde dehydrogenase [Elusimicrobiota bacterium]
MREYKVAVAGATGAVGREMIKMLERLDFPLGELRLLASSRSAGKKLLFKGKEITVEELSPEWIAKNELDVLIMSAGGSVSEEYAPLFRDKKVYVIDNSSAWRMDKGVPLVVPEINPETLSKDKYIIANPNCSTIQMVHALAPLHRAAGIKRITAVTFQAVSGAGQKAITELEKESRQITDGGFAGKKLPGNDFSPFPRQIAFNCIPQIDVFLENGFTKEEMKMVNETKKIIDPAIELSVTCVRVPVFRGHSEAVSVEFAKDISVEEARSLLEKEPGIKVVDDTALLKYPTAIDAGGELETFVGRIRKDESRVNGLWLWIVSDNLLKGAALNAVQIAQKLIEII